MTAALMLDATDEAALDAAYATLGPARAGKLSSLMDGEAATSSPSEADWQLLVLLAEGGIRDPEQLVRIASTAEIAHAVTLYHDGKAAGAFKDRGAKWQRLVESQAKKVLAATERGWRNQRNSAVTPEPVQVISARELATPENLAPVTAVAWGMAYRDRVMLFASREKAGKSTLLTAAVAAITTGRPFLGQPTVPGYVLWISADIEAPADLVQRLQRFGADLDKVGIIYPRQRADLQDALDQHPETVLVVIDTLHPFVAHEVQKASQSDDWARVLPDFNRTAQSRHVAIVLNHHAPANDEAKGYRDSTAIGGWVDGIVTMKVNGTVAGQRDLKAVCRFQGGPPREFSLVLDGTVFRYVNQLVPVDVEPKVVAFVAAHPGTSLAQIREHINRARDETRAVVTRLVDRGVLLDVPHGKNHRYSVKARDDEVTASGARI